MLGAYGLMFCIDHFVHAGAQPDSSPSPLPRSPLSASAPITRVARVAGLSPTYFFSHEHDTCDGKCVGLLIGCAVLGGAGLACQLMSIRRQLRGAP